MRRSVLALVSILLLMAAFSGCEKTELYEPKTTGTLSLFFTNHSALTIYVHVRAIENTDIVLFVYKVDRMGNIIEELNAGNYYLTVSAHDSSFNYKYFSNTGFQIKAGQTTSIKWGSHNGIEGP
jgi:hypothetical protein